MENKTSTSTSLISKLLDSQNVFFNEGETRTYNFRLNALLKLKEAIVQNEKEIHEALKKDLNKCEFESHVSETGFVLLDIEHSISKLKKWMKPKRVYSPIAHWPCTSFVIKKPFGKVLIIGPWNYPFQLVIAPLIGAIAAGNTAILKPSELAPYTSKIIAKIINETFPSNFIYVVEGGIEETTKLLDSKFEYIFYTGSTQVGKIIMSKAAQNLTPVTLELGGKSPCLVFGPVDLELAAKRIAWGKFINAGQTCVAPDYILIQKDLKNNFIRYFAKILIDFYGENAQGSLDYGRIINDRHFQRLNNYLLGSKILLGGHTDRESRYIEPTLIEAMLDKSVMTEEIFGPILPIVEVSSFHEAINFIKCRPKPLASYLFTGSKIFQSEFQESISSGGMCINDTVLQLTNSHLPFGGIGDSGIGFYHGEFSFDTFSHRQSVMKRILAFDLTLKYPPYLGKLPIVRWLLKYLG